MLDEERVLSSYSLTILLVKINDVSGKWIGNNKQPGSSKYQMCYLIAFFFKEKVAKGNLY